MAYVTVPKDLTQCKIQDCVWAYQTATDLFRRCAARRRPALFFIRGQVTTSAAALIMVFAMLPGFLLALYERHGQPLEVVVWQIVQCCFIQPKESALPNQQRLYRPYAAAPNGKGGKCDCPKSKAKERKSACKAHPRRKERNSGHHPASIRATEKPHSAQASIPYEAMYRTGFAR